ncbi:M28 family metallopeptidase [Amphiplicatus metriothermophilus]|uniref:Zn-dependent amino- or carboxypeptidase, M28 family n=1 Tax=Amphiplicatus metriothermophilus TaxID=1519374 RepID=A0A239PXU7_9PROT|nr:M28 family metallopeptidase [Amphiplicatus metriothermophilus]MBB5519817.1 Zn-dependent M28 family amino/carboxypeptidase [Amphiplicatus metriothermophilus]SNT75141.1 Zn-dependent amino- or carboxypeptidase, M28 family [Amphiplicatus metriothermophilus]
MKNTGRTALFRRAGAAIAFLTLAACTTQAERHLLDGPTQAAVAAVAHAQTSAERIRADVAWLADDARAGREAGTPGYDAAARYVAEHFASLGLEPAGETGWFQQVSLRTVRRDAAAAHMSALIGGEAVSFAHLEDYLIGRPPAAAAFDVTAPAVFVGYGVTDPQGGHDDYRGVDAQGKIVVAFAGAPRAFDSEKRAHYASTSVKMENAAAHGAAGFISIPSEASEARASWERIISHADSPAMSWVHPDGRVETSAPSITATARLSAAGASKLFAGAPLSYEELRAREADEAGALQSFDLPAIVALRGRVFHEEAQSANVAGLLRGVDPALKDEVVVLTAHLDHVGVRAPEEEGGDGIHNGAFDNAMGVAMMLEAARRFMEESAPARSILFLAVTAEEKGLLGADYFAHYPTVPIDRIVANVNLDMPLVMYPFTDVIAFGAERSTLGPLAKEAAGEMGVALSPDPFPEQGIFTRSDHYRFVEKGVPSVFLFLGFGNGGDKVFADFMREHYHKPSDDLTLPADYEAAARFAELNYRVARKIADASERPRWNEGDFFGELFGR